jgi:hypothetical protein
MNKRQVLPLVLAMGAGVAFIAPSVALAGPSHFAPNEAGVMYHPNETGPAQSEAQVAADLANAQAKPEWAGMLRWGSMSTPKVGSGKSREEVLAELQAAQRQPNWDAASRLGAPLPAPKANTIATRATAQP